MNLDETVHEVSEPSPPEADLTEQQIKNNPTIFITKTEWGGVEFGSNTPSLSLLDAIAMLEIVKAELALQQIKGQNMEREKRNPLSGLHLPR